MVNVFSLDLKGCFSYFAPNIPVSTTCSTPVCWICFAFTCYCCYISPIRRGNYFLFYAVIKLHLFSCAFFLISLWKRPHSHGFMPDWSTEPHFLPISVLQVTKVVSPWSLKWKKLTVPFRKKTPFVPTLLLMTNDIMKGLLACFCPCCCWGGSQHSLRDSLGVCSSEHCLGAQSTCCVSGKILITLVRLCVLGTPDGASLLTEDYLGWRIAVRQQPGPVP